VLRNHRICSAEGSIRRDIRDDATPPDPGKRSVQWRGLLYELGEATGDRAVPFPQNLWIESWTFRNLNPSPETISQIGLFLRIPWWPFIAAFGALPATRLLAWARSRRYARTGGCPACGYDLRHSPHRCPECGREVDSAGAAAVA
jgi:hypothetical protein